jgi:thioredoxin:protein disulfide reductase
LWLQLSDFPDGNDMKTRSLRPWAVCLNAQIAIGAALALAAAEESPFAVSVTNQATATGTVLQVSFQVPPNCVLYADRLHFLTAEGNEITPLSIPEPVMEWDKTRQTNRGVYEHSFCVAVPALAQTNQQLILKLQGCTNGACFAPERRTFARNPSGAFFEVADTDESSPAAGSAAEELKHALDGFKVASRQTGYMKASDFVGFLDRSASGQGDADDPLARFKNLGLAATLFLIVLGGFLLNLTPCVLPMIPINLAIIGAGTQARSRVEGFRNGSVYGLGMALAYGTLGLLVVLTGAKFGSLNSTTWFNYLVALVFVVLALGMFDVIHIDLSRFGSGFGPQADKAAGGTALRFLVIFIMGSLAALLAGACVAPVVISVMLLATNLYAKGLLAGLLLPFLLGVGMALPWPVAGAGLAIMPKPGKWMNRVKYGFGVVILFFAAYYGHLGYRAFAAGRPTASDLASDPATSVATASSDADQAKQDFFKALERGRTEAKPVFVDFHASWCKNCLAMDETVFNQPSVQQKLKDFVVVRYAAERPNISPTKEVLDHFGVMGLPSYVVVRATK